MSSWLARVRHDLIKHVVWRARDVRDLGDKARPEDVQALKRLILALPDPEGRPVGIAAAWRVLVEDEAAPGDKARVESFARAVSAVQSWAQAGDQEVSLVLALEAAYDELARDLRGAASP